MEVKHGIFLIGQLQPIFIWILCGNSHLKLNKEPHIALEASVIEYVDTEIDIFGSLQDVDMNCQVST
jgi:hypothetical protein